MSDNDIETSGAVEGSAFSIEGHSQWLSLMRGMAFATMASILVMAAVFHFLTGDDGFVETQQLGMVMGGSILLLVFSYFLFLIVVIPRQENYGRYVISQHQVAFYLLTPLGLGIRNKAELVNISKFMGIATSPITDKKGKVSYAVYLVHATNKGKTINVQSFPAIGEAEEYAAELGNTLRLNVVTRKTRASVAAES